jgi:protein-L-isoaspartate(D-aspartate) O-methyltransferase
LVQQLAIEGRMVLPIGSLEGQDVVLVRNTADGIKTARLDGCAFVPLIGEEGFRETS